MRQRRSEHNEDAGEEEREHEAERNKQSARQGTAVVSRWIGKASLQA